MPFEDSLGRIQDILDSAVKIQRYSAGLSREAFRADEIAVDAVIYNFIIIGEAANHVSPELMTRYPDVPWHQMRGLRNAAVHEYPRVDIGVNWEAAAIYVPALIPQLREILEREQ